MLVDGYLGLRSWSWIWSLYKRPSENRFFVGGGLSKATKKTAWLAQVMTVGRDKQARSGKDLSSLKLPKIIK